MSRNGYKAVIFDFDYTLGDSSLGIIDSTNYALDKMGLPFASDERIRETIGLSLTDTFAKLMGNEDDSMARRFHDLFIERADEVMVDATVIFEKVPDAIESLASRGIGLGIVTSKFRRRIEEILEREKLLEGFGIIVGSEDVAAGKPDPSGLLRAIDSLSSTSSTALYVGDSVTDAETAKRADVTFVAVLSGVTPRESFESYAVHEILEDVSQVPQLIG